MPRVLKFCRTVVATRCCFAAFGVLLLVMSDTGMAQENTPQFSHQKIILMQGEKQEVFTVELADDTPKRRHGLMFRKSLPEDHGMLFVWQEPADIKMWMKNTYIPLDMLYFRQHKLVGVVQNAVPFSEEVLGVNALADMVLEIPAGQAKQRGLIVGEWTLKPLGPAQK